ncbi:ABC transporter substrate-binding protein [Phyllobacterium sp. SB3]|uniref:ABC transporter substrate-binding protein n=1 Tax=Phyllobacterium sp. SB3 TaxID=3156073 RepID=UPI0032AEBBAA
MHEKSGRADLSWTVNRRTVLKTASLMGVSVLGDLGPVLAAANGVLKLRLLADIQNLDPAFEPQDHDLQVIFNIYENLVSFEPGTFDLVNTLAEEWTPSSDGLKFDFRLKKGIQFHRGFGEVTAQDVKFSFERIAGMTVPAIDSPYKKLWGALKEVQVTGQYTGSIILKSATAPLMNLTIPGNVGQIVSRKAVEQLGEQYATNPVGTGPYEFIEWVPRERVVLRKFKDYSGASSAYAAAPEWVEIQFVPITADSNAEIALETKEIDFGSLPLSSVSRFEDNKAFSVTERTGFAYKFIGMNVNDPVLKDINVRQAIRHAIDVPSILVAAFEDRWQRATAVLPPSMPIGYWKDAPVLQRDVDVAKSFMVKAGSPVTGLTFTYNNSEAGASAVAEIVQANLADIGITVDVVPQENAVAMQTGKDAQKGRQIFYVGYGSQGDPAQSMSWFTCEQIDKWNFIDWCDPKFTDLAAQGILEQDSKRRLAIYLEMQQLWEEAANVVWVAWPTFFFATRQGLTPSLRPDGRMLAWNFRSA